MPEFNTQGINARRLFDDVIHDKDLVCLFPLNEKSGTVYDRGTLYRMTGTAAGNPTYSKSVLGGQFYGIDFDGTGDLISLGDVTGLNFERTNAFSVLAIVVPDDLTQSRTIVSKYDATADRGWFFRLSGDAAPLVNLRLSNGAANLLLAVSTTAVTEGAASMLGVSYDGSSTQAGTLLYINGTGDTNAGGAPSLSATILTSDAAQIGARDSSELWNGDLAFIAVFSGVKTPSQFRRWAYLAGFYP